MFVYDRCKCTDGAVSHYPSALHSPHPHYSGGIQPVLVPYSRAVYVAVSFQHSQDYVQKTRSERLLMGCQDLPLLQVQQP